MTPIRTRRIYRDVNGFASASSGVLTARPGGSDVTSHIRWELAATQSAQLRAFSGPHWGLMIVRHIGLGPRDFSPSDRA